GCPANVAAGHPGTTNHGRVAMGRVGHVGTWPGDNRTIDAAGWQCTAPDPDALGGRCRLIATHTHRRRVDGKIRVAALCPGHYDAAGPEARLRGRAALHRRVGQARQSDATPTP
ncbi:MAG: hypothetical protein ACRDQU_06890, partial [Pseudonocardiaceae bacterium]